MGGGALPVATGCRHVPRPHGKRRRGQQARPAADRGRRAAGSERSPGTPGRRPSPARGPAGTRLLRRLRGEASSRAAAQRGGRAPTGQAAGGASGAAAPRPVPSSSPGRPWLRLSGGRARGSPGGCSNCSRVARGAEDPTGRGCLSLPARAAPSERPCARPPPRSRRGACSAAGPGREKPQEGSEGRPRAPQARVGQTLGSRGLLGKGSRDCAGHAGRGAGLRGACRERGGAAAAGVL